MAAMAKAALLFIATIHAFAPHINTPVKKHAPLFAKPTEVHYALNAELSKEQSPAKLVALVEERSQDFNGVNMATALRRLATAPLGRQPRARAAGLVAARLETSLAERPDDFDARSVATACWAFAKLGLGVPGALARAAAGLAARMEPRELATTAWAPRRPLATPTPRRRRLRRAAAGETEAALKAAADGATRRAKALSGRDASTVVFALATAKDVANAAWAYASAREPAPRLFGAFSAFAAANASRLSPQGVATLAWAFATQRRCPRGTGVAGDRPSQDAAAFSALAARGAAVSRELDARSLALLSWAFAASRRGGRSLAPLCEDTLFEALEAHAIPRLARLARLGGARVVNGDGRARLPPGLRGRGRGRGARARGPVVAPGAGERALGLRDAAVGLRPRPPLRRFEDAVVAKADALASRDVATVLWAYAARRRLSEAPRPDAVRRGRVAGSPRRRRPSPRTSPGPSPRSTPTAAVWTTRGGRWGWMPCSRPSRRWRCPPRWPPARQLATPRAFAAVRADAPEPTLLGALGRAAAADARALSPLDAAMVADAASRCRASGNARRWRRSPTTPRTGRRPSARRSGRTSPRARGLRLRGPRALRRGRGAVFPRVADDAKLLPVPTTAYAANDTDRVTVLEVVPYDAMFLAPLGGGPGGDAGAPRRDDPIRELDVPPQNADVASL
ncbi:hypothetical protein JL720_10118 [Aureococcus anophagefferens]|nr:hypothetical protein JL720_10118 [Aureococcus anophagefferens]